MRSVPINGSNVYHRDVKNHAVININNAEYEAFIRQRDIFRNAKATALIQTATIETLMTDVESLKILVMQLLNKDANGPSA